MNSDYYATTIATHAAICFKPSSGWIQTPNGGEITIVWDKFQTLLGWIQTVRATTRPPLKTSLLPKAWDSAGYSSGFSRHMWADIQKA